MADRISKTQRWLDLIAYLVGRRMAVTVGELMEKVPAYALKYRTGDETDRESVRRMFERDKKELRRLGVPIESVAIPSDELGEQQAYRLGARDFFLPYLKLVSGQQGVQAHPAGPSKVTTVELAPEAAEAARDALRFIESVPGFPYAADARSAQRKLALGTGQEATTSPEVPLLVLDDAGAAEIVERVRTLSEALLARKRVLFRYHGIHRGEATDRDVAPYGLMFQHGHWYLVGHDALRDGIRVFRVERMEPPRQKSASGDAEYEIPGDFRLRDHLGREPWELGQGGEEALKAVVRFEFPTSLWAERNQRGRLVGEESQGAQLRAFDVTQVDPFVRWVLSLEGRALVLEPPELRLAVGETAARGAALHRRPPLGGAEVGGG